MTEENDKKINIIIPTKHYWIDIEKQNKWTIKITQTKGPRTWWWNLRFSLSTHSGSLSNSVYTFWKCLAIKCISKFSMDTGKREIISHTSQAHNVKITSFNQLRYAARCRQTMTSYRVDSNVYFGRIKVSISS